MEFLSDTGRNVKRRRIETYLQILARMSPLPVAKSWPVGLGATEMTDEGETLSIEATPVE